MRCSLLPPKRSPCSLCPPPDRHHTIICHPPMMMLTLALFLSALNPSDAFSTRQPSAATGKIHIRHMTPPLRPGEKADTTPFDSSDYFKSRGMDVDPQANVNPLDIKENVFVTTDVGDFYPEGYVDELASVIPRCSQNVVVQETNKIPIGVLEEQMNAARVRTSDPDPALPGQEYMNDDYWEDDPVNHFVGGGLEECNPYTQQCIPEGMQFIAASVPDGQVNMQVSRTSAGEAFTIEVQPYCMGFEDYFAGFTADSHPSFSVSPNAGRLDRRGGESTFLELICDPRGYEMSGVWEANLVINVPEDESQLTYKIVANVS